MAAETFLSPFKVLPPASGCRECGRDHEAELPHDLQSLTYQYQFYAEHGRWPTWHDALRHCAADLRAHWLRILRDEYGVDAGEDPGAPEAKP